MSSFRQIAANRRNASKSTGPRTEEGKQRALQRGAPRPDRRDGDRRVGGCGGLQGVRSSHYGRLRCPIVGRARVGAAAGQPLVAAAPRHDHGNWPVRNSGRPSGRGQEGTSSCSPTRGRLFMRCSGSTPFRTGTSRRRSQAAKQKRRISAIQHSNSPIVLRLNSRVAFCGSLTCRISHSTVSTATKPLSGAK